MKKPSTLVLILLFITQGLFAQETACARTTYFGSVQICLPTVQGYVESYTDPVIKQIADGTEVPANMVLGYYLNTETFEGKGNIGVERYEDYFKIYGTKQIKNYPADTKLVKEMQGMLNNNFVSENWENMEKEIDKINLDVKIGVPTVIKSYNLNENSFSFIMITRYQLDGSSESYTMAMTVNGIVIKKRMVWMAYYLDYKGEETIERLQKNSNKIVLDIMAANK